MTLELEQLRLNLRIISLMVMLDIFNAKHKAAYDDNEMSIEAFTEAMLKTAQCRDNMTEVSDNLHLLSMEQIVALSKELDSLFELR